MHRVYSFCNFILFMEFSVVKDVSTWRMSSNWHSWKSDSFSFFIFFISFFLRNSSFSLACLFAWWIIDAYVSVAEEKNTNLCIFQRKKNSSRTSVNWWSSWITIVTWNLSRENPYENCQIDTKKKTSVLGHNIRRANNISVKQHYYNWCAQCDSALYTVYCSSTC